MLALKLGCYSKAQLAFENLDTLLLARCMATDSSTCSSLLNLVAHSVADLTTRAADKLD
jgi:hypothetical protein